MPRVNSNKNVTGKEPLLEKMFPAIIGDTSSQRSSGAEQRFCNDGSALVRIAPAPSAPVVGWGGHCCGLLWPCVGVTRTSKTAS